MQVSLTFNIDDLVIMFCLFFFFFKQKTAYEMRISDWSSDVCSSDLLITSDYWDADQHRTDTAIYDVVWRIEGRLLRGRMLRLKGLVLRERSDSPKRINSLWAHEKPASSAASLLKARRSRRSARYRRRGTAVRRQVRNRGGHRGPAN